MTNDRPTAAAGWYPLPGGGKRFWNGQEWTMDVIGAPNSEAEFAALAPDLPAPDSIVLAPPQPTPPQVLPASHGAGWYPGPAGMMQWWDGVSWGPYAPTAARPAKDVGVAYLFLLLLGGVAAHRFYLGRIGSAIAFCCLWWGGWLTSLFIIGIPLLIAAVIWWIVDLFLLPSMVRATNAAPLRLR